MVRLLFIWWDCHSCGETAYGEPFWSFLVPIAATAQSNLSKTLIFNSLEKPERVLVILNLKIPNNRIRFEVALRWWDAVWNPNFGCETLEAICLNFVGLTVCGKKFLVKDIELKFVSQKFFFLILLLKSVDWLGDLLVSRLPAWLRKASNFKFSVVNNKDILGIGKLKPFANLGLASISNINLL